MRRAAASRLQPLLRQFNDALSLEQNASWVLRACINCFQKLLHIIVVLFGSTPITASNVYQKRRDQVACPI